MKSVSPELRAIIEQAYTVKATPKLLVEWEHNRFSDFADPDPDDPNSGAVTLLPDLDEDDVDPEWVGIYPIDSILDPNRPGTGIAKSRFRPNGTLDSAWSYQSNRGPRYYLASEDDTYQYWSSPQRTSPTVVNGDYVFPEEIQITVMYKEAVVANKVVVGFETSFARPDAYSLEVITTAGTVSVPGGTLAADGTFTVWKSRDSNSWSTTPSTYSPFDVVRDSSNNIILDSNGNRVEGDPLTRVPNVRGVRLRVTSLTAGNEHLDVIQLGARLEADLSSLVEEYTSEFEVSDRSLITPLGGASSNTGSVTLYNVQMSLPNDQIGGMLNNDNERSPFYGLIGKKAKFTGSLVYDLRPVADRFEEVREFTMWVDTWGGQTDLSTSVDLKDSSIFLQEIPCPMVFWGEAPSLPVNKKNSRETADRPYIMRVGAVIWQLLDIVGFSNHFHDSTDLVDGQVVDFFWPEEGDTVWDIISELAQATQTAVYFDEFDVLQIKPRGTLFRAAEQTPDWTLNASRVGAKQPDIVTFDVEDEFVANKVKVTYNPTKFEMNTNGFPKLKTVWEPEEESVLLRGTGLTKDFLKAHTGFWMDAKEASHWPYTGMVNIEGEIITYNAKGYYYTAPGGERKFAWIDSKEKKAEIDNASDELLRFTNTWTGSFRVTERGVGLSSPADHRVKPIGYNALITNWANTTTIPLSTTWGRTYADGHITLTLNGRKGDDLFVVKHESAVPVANAAYGGGLRFPTQQIQSSNWAVGGFFFAGDTLDGGYYLEIASTETVERYKRSQHEISLVAMPSNGRARRLAGGATGSAKGTKTPIVRGKWYNFDIRHVVLPGNIAAISVYMDGVFMGKWTVPYATRNDWSNIGHFGMFQRYNGRVDFEYLYGFDVNGGVAEYYLRDPDASPVLDFVQGGFISGYTMRDWRYSAYKKLNVSPRKSKKKWRIKTLNSRTRFVLDEFGPMIHEMREFNVNFDDNTIPVAYAQLFMTNEKQVEILDWNFNNTSASFTLVNTARTDAVVHGEDAITLGVDNKIDQKLMVYGQPLIQEDDLVQEREDKNSIRKIGLTAVDFSNRFIQSETSAKGLADWVVSVWGQGIEEAQVEVFGNPMLQIGDLVAVEYPEKSMAATTHKFYVVGKDNEFSEGFVTRLILRRAKV